MRVTCCRVDFVPPPKPHEAPPGDVLEVVEVCGEEEEGDDEDEDAGGGMLAGWVNGLPVGEGWDGRTSCR